MVYRASRSRGAFCRFRSPGTKVFDKNYFVLRLVVDQLIGQSTAHCNPESPWAHTELLADGHMRNRLIRRVPRGRMSQALETEPSARVSDAIQQHARGAHVGNAYLAVRIQFASPLHRIE